jgi:hypothetical protein
VHGVLSELGPGGLGSGRQRRGEEPDEKDERLFLMDRFSCFEKRVDGAQDPPAALLQA